jgi:hypothetical protein
MGPPILRDAHCVRSQDEAERGRRGKPGTQALLDHLVDAEQHERIRDRQPERLRGLEIEH